MVISGRNSWQQMTTLYQSAEGNWIVLKVDVIWAAGVKSLSVKCENIGRRKYE
jgi:hypothetical protein